MKPVTFLAALASLLSAGLTARAEGPHLALEGTYAFVAGYKADNCSRKITVKALFDSQTGKPTELDVYDPSRPNADGRPSISLYNNGTTLGADSVGGGLKWVNTITDTLAENVKYEYIFGIRHALSDTWVQLKQTWLYGEELHIFDGDKCIYRRVSEN